MKPLSYVFIGVFILGQSCYSPGIQPETKALVNPEITAVEIQDHINFLAADTLGGRFPGTDGSLKAIDYIIRNWESAGVQPAGSEGYKQYFEFVRGIELGEKTRMVVGQEPLQVKEDFIPLGFSANGVLDTTVIFAGYGFSISDSLVWDDYATVDVSGKWVLILRGGPDEDNPHTPYGPHLALRKKVLVAKDNGAGGVLFVSQAGEAVDDDLLRLRYDHSFSGAGIPVLQITQTVAEQLLDLSGTSLKDLQSALNEDLKPKSLHLMGVRISAQVELKKSTVQIANLIGLVPGNDPALKDEYVVIGAHFDHLGFGGTGSGSLIPDTAAVHNGADDNASGVAGVLEIGFRLAASRNDLKRSVLLMCYNAEEEGLLGSKNWVKQASVDLSTVSTMINLDMIGRMQNNTITIGGTGTSPEFETVLTELNRPYELNLRFSEEGYGPSDHASFYTNDIPVLFFFSGTHEDYHKPSDDWDKINAEGEKKIADFVYDTAVYLSQLEERPPFTEAGPKEPVATRRSFKVTFGVIPAYGSPAEGMEIDGTRKDGPAARAGMKKGDIIVAIDGKEITNIYDYMYRLAELKPGQVVLVTVKRGEETLEISVEL